MSIIDQIRSEVERRIKSWSTRGENSPEGQGKDTCVSRVTELTDLLSFLDTLEKEEKPMNQEGLEEEFIRYIHEKDAEVSERSESTYAQEDLEDIARHFAKWGAEHLATPAK